MRDFLVVVSNKAKQRQVRGAFFIIVGALLVFLSVGSAAPAQPVRTATGISLPYGNATIELTAERNFAFRIGIYSKGSRTMNSVFIDRKNAAPEKFSVINQSPVYGIKTSYGKLVMNVQSGNWRIFDKKGHAFINKGTIRHSDSIQVISYTADPAAQYYGAGNYSSKDLIKQKSVAELGNGTADIPYLWSNRGYSLLGITSDDNDPAKWASDADSVSWHFSGPSANLYIWPANTLYDAAKGFAQLTGKPKLPPLWAFGYLQSQWGWRDSAYIDDVLKNFRTRHLPVDAFIFDFEWYTTTPDYSIGKLGEKDFSDFSFNPTLFPDPSKQIAGYKKQGVKFIGIRKPRLGNAVNLQLARKNGWLIRPGSDSRDLNFSVPSLHKWYERKMMPLVDSGVNAWWNDEGESYYSCYYWWNKSEADLLDKAKPNERHFSINRSFSPGNQRFGYCTWSGDIQSDWKDLRQVPKDLLNFSLAGMDYGSCDIGGFQGQSIPARPTKEILVRWFEAGAFLPVMRAHSNIMTTPHFPWLWGADAERAIRKALQLRYRLIPYLYSLGHEAYETGIPIMRPLVMEFQGDPKVANLTDEWLLGKGLLAAPVLDSGGIRSVYLPGDTWYDFNTGKSIQGPIAFTVTKALDEIPVFVRAGTILPLASSAQHTEQLTDGPLEMNIYPGHNATFILTQDDGHTYDYTKGIMRKTVFSWNDTDKTFSWKISGKYSGNNIYKTARVVLNGISKSIPLDTGGSVHF